jgi:hypothetical protein
MVSTLRIRLRAIRALGIANIARVAWYRARLRYGVHPVQHLRVASTPSGEFFRAPRVTHPRRPSTAWREHGNYFGWFRPELSGVPAWHANPFTGATAQVADAPWWSIPDFDSGIGDVKTVWEASRFDWVVSTATRAKAGDGDAVRQLNAWIDDWCAKNPPYRGANWKCGQEASIRVMHLAIAAMILDSIDAPMPALLSLLELHCQRIAPTTGYAIGQANNHGTSEAAALFVAGTWLQRHGVRAGEAFAQQGRGLLANRVGELVEPDGSFSQHSVNYHRLMLETLSLAEVWRRSLALPPFDPIVSKRGAAATRWLHAMVDATTGDAPNLGANDGAHLLAITDLDYRDYRPAVQLAAALFLDRLAYQDVPDVQLHLQWLGIEAPAQSLPPAASSRFDDGGYAVLMTGQTMALLRYPRYRFRPGHADALHVELRIEHQIVLRDGGSYGYNAGAEWAEYFVGAHGQNTIQFDDHEQMPLVSRFLWGEWLSTSERSDIVDDAGAQRMSASYRDWTGAAHSRTIVLSDGALDVIDGVTGFHTRAVLRWRLQPGEWTLDGATLSKGAVHLTVSADVPIVRMELVRGWESRYYLHKTELPVLEVEVTRPGHLRTRVDWPRTHAASSTAAP